MTGEVWPARGEDSRVTRQRWLVTGEGSPMTGEGLPATGEGSRSTRQRRPLRGKGWRVTGEGWPLMRQRLPVPRAYTSSLSPTARASGAAALGKLFTTFSASWLSRMVFDSVKLVLTQKNRATAR